MGKVREPFELNKRKQTQIQTDVLKRVGRSARLAEALSQATHNHAQTFLKSTNDFRETACTSECAYCCYQPATVFSFEAIHLAEILRNTLSQDKLNALIVKMKSRVSGLKNQSVRENINNKTPCPLLLDSGSCSVYEHRPLTCRMAHSFSVNKCKQAYEKDRFKVQIPVSYDLQTGLSGIIDGVYERFNPLYELCSALLAVLGDQNAAAKWAQGDDSAFRDCIVDDT